MRLNQASPLVDLPAPLPQNVTISGGAGIGAALPVAPLAGQTVLTVGAAGEYQTIGAAVAAAQNGDLILVAPGTYVNDFADVTAQVTIAGAGGIATLVATEALPNEKGIFVTDANCTIENLSFQGAAISDADGGNGAGIRYQGGNLVLNNDSFIGNQDGILAAAVDDLPQNTVTILHSSFDDNGQTSGPNAGYTHNAYISTGITSLVAEQDVFEQANIGHELKSRAQANLISGNIFYDGPGGTASYDIDLPNGGADTVSGNVIEKGPQASNTALIHFGGEGIPYAGSSLTVTGNRLIDDLGPQAVGVLNQTTIPVSISGNEFDNFLAANLGAGAYAQSGNWDQNGNAIAPDTSTQFAPGTLLDDFSGDSASHVVTLTTATGVLGGAGLVSVFAQAGHVTVQGGTGGLNFQEAPGYGGSMIATAAGASDTVVALGQDVVAANGMDSIQGGAGNLTVQVDGQASIASGSGNNAYVINGAAVITGNDGGDTVQLNTATAAASITGTESYFQATVNGGRLSYDISQDNAPAQATISGGGVADRIYNGGQNITTAGGQGACLSFGAGTVTALFSQGRDTINAGSGADTVIVSASAQITAGSGALSVFGRGESGTATVFGAAGVVSIGGDSGGILYEGGAQANSVQAALSNITVQGGAGRLSVAGGSAQTITGGSGGLIFTTAGGGDQITTQANAADTISVIGACTITSNGADLINAGGGNSTLTANGRATITGSTGNALYMLGGQDQLTAYGASRVTVGTAACDTVAALGNFTSVSVAGGHLAFHDLGRGGVTVSGACITITDAGALPAITLGAINDRATLSGGTARLSAGAGAHILALSGADSVTLNGGNALLQAGGGSVTLSMQDWNDSATTTVLAGAGLLNAAAGYGNLVFVGGTGAASLGGVSGGETVQAGTGNITLGGGHAGTVFNACTSSAAAQAQVTLSASGGKIIFGTGATSVTEAGYGQAVLYDFNAGTGGGTDSIIGFRPGTDQLVFNGVSIAQQSAGAAGTQLVLSDGTHVLLVGVALAAGH